MYCQDLPSVGSTLSLESVRKEEAGLYQCLASNGVEDEDQEIYAVIKLTVHCKSYPSQRARDTKLKLSLRNPAGWLAYFSYLRKLSHI